MTCQAPPGEKVLVTPLLGGVLWKEIAKTIDDAAKRHGDRLYASLYGYTGDLAFILLLYFEKGRVAAVCYDSGREVYAGERAVPRIGELLAGEASGLLEIVKPGKRAEPPAEYRLRRPRPLEELAARAQPRRAPARDRPAPAPVSLEGMDGLQVGMLLSEVILKSRLVASAKSVEEAIRRARHESRRDRRGLYRVAVFVEDGSIYNIFIKDGRIRRVLLLAPSGIEGRVLRRDENIRDILASVKVKGASVYRVECPECERLILSG